MPIVTFDFPTLLGRIHFLILLFNNASYTYITKQEIWRVKKNGERKQDKCDPAPENSGVYIF